MWYEADYCLKHFKLVIVYAEFPEYNVKQVKNSRYTVREEKSGIPVLI